MLSVAELDDPENPPIHTTLGDGWNLEFKPEQIDVDTPENLRINLTGDLPNSTISIRRMKFPDEDHHLLNPQGEVVIDSEQFSEKAIDRQLVEENLGAYIEGTCWPLAIATLNYHWGRILEVDILADNYYAPPTSLKFFKRVPPVQDISAQLPIRFEMNFVDRHNQQLNTHEFEINTLPHPVRSVNFGPRSVACSIQITLADGEQYHPQWFIKPLLAPIRRLINPPDMIPMEEWYGATSDSIEIEVEELAVHKGNGVEWRTTRVAMSREQLKQMWNEEGCQFEQLEIEFMDEYTGDSYPTVSIDSEGHHLHALIEHNLRGAALDYFSTHAIFRAFHRCCNSREPIHEWFEQSRISDNIQEVNIDVNPPDGDGNLHQIQLQGSAQNGTRFNQSDQLTFPDLILPIYDLPNGFEEAGYRYVCMFAVKPDPSSLQITASCKLYNTEDYSLYFHETCNFDDFRPDGSEGCGRQIKDCICDHPDGPIRTKTWRNYNADIPMKDCKFREHDGHWYFAISQQRLDSLPGLLSYFHILIRDTLVKRRIYFEISEVD